VVSTQEGTALNTGQDFANWQDRNGLRRSDAAGIVYLRHAVSVSRLRSAETVHPRVAALAAVYEAGRFVSDDLDEVAETLGYADLCAAVPFSVVTGVSAATLRGWTTAHVNDRFVALPPHPAALRQPDRVLALACPVLPDHVELRRDGAGRWYRLADPVRTVVDTVRDDVRQGRFHAREVVNAAVDEGVSPEALLAYAARVGEHAVTKLNEYLDA